MHAEKIFSYGTLQYENVQLANFGRILKGSKDSLSNFKLTTLEIKDSNVIAQSGENTHPIISYTGNPDNTVHGTVFDLSPEELIQADSYEVAEYKRVKAQLDSGTYAWVYVSSADPLLLA